MYKELNLKNNIYDLTKFTTTDYKDYLSCVVWFLKCNMRCLYCYNNDIVLSNKGSFSQAYVLDFLKTRVNLLDAVVLSGGEATVHELKEFCLEIKKLGFKIKLDTNGLQSKKIKELINLKLIDYLALDFKALESKFKKITYSSDFKNFEETLDFLINSDFDYEIRTTVNADLLSEDDVNEMIDFLSKKNYKKNYYIQSFLQTESNLGKISQVKIFNKNKINKDKLNIFFRN